MIIPRNQLSKLSRRELIRLVERGDFEDTDGLYVSALKLPVEKAVAGEINTCILQQIVYDRDLRRFDYRYEYSWLKKTAYFVFKGEKKTVERYVYTASALATGE